MSRPRLVSRELYPEHQGPASCNRVQARSYASVSGRATLELRKYEKHAPSELWRSEDNGASWALAEEIPSICVNGQLAKRVCNTSNIRFSGIDGQAMLAQLDCRGVYCSQGSACESMRPEPSHVLRAMGLSEQEAYSSIRFSFSPLNTIAEVHQAVKAIAEAYGFLQGDFEPQPVGTGLVGDE